MFCLSIKIPRHNPTPQSHATPRSHANTTIPMNTPSEGNCFKALALIEFASGKSKDYSSHWLKRQMKSERVSKSFQRLLKEDNLFPGKGRHQIYILDKETALHFISLFPREWPWPH